MQKPERISWRDTNLALIGSDLDHKVKAAAAEGEEAWDGIRTKEGLHVWRIEKFLVKAWPVKQYGQFHRGDSYIIMNTYGTDPSNLSYDIHIWIGSESSQDEYGTAAYKMVEADDYLGGMAVQHRQVEGQEAPEFCQYFENGLQYLQGGIETGFTHVGEPSKEKPLFFKFRRRDNEKKTGELVQVPMSCSSMDSDSAFILYADKSSVWAWHGKDCPPMEKIAATNQGDKLCTLATVTVLAQGDGDDEETEFWNYLDGSGSSESDSGEKSRSIGGATITTKSSSSSSSRSFKDYKPKLFVVDSDPTKELTPVGLGKLIQKVATLKLGSSGGGKFLNRGLLDDSDVFLLDVGSKIFVWIGTAADSGEKLAALGAVDRYADLEPRAKEVPVTVLKAGQERSGFMSYFK
mmetsp:Transcript_31155/g.35845  ORF Transcript_31155/g.35845 Transcript_31155/m.35845 type:complete len:405 (+) Transcript_31155:103-1317(+)